MCNLEIQTVRLLHCQQRQLGLLCSSLSTNLNLLCIKCMFSIRFFLQPLRDDPDRVFVGRKRAGMEGCVSIYSLRDRFDPPEGKRTF